MKYFGEELNWEEIIGRILAVLFLAFMTGMTLYASQNMTPEEKNNFILMLQHWE